MATVNKVPRYLLGILLLAASFVAIPSVSKVGGEGLTGVLFA